MSKALMFTCAIALVASAGLRAADAIPTDQGEKTKVTEPPKQVLPTGALIFAIRPEGNTVQVNRISTPAMRTWQIGQELMTGPAQYAHLLLADRTTMTLGPESNAVLQQNPVLTTGANDTTVQLRKGALQVITSKLATENGFRVNTPLGDAVSVGTNYNVEITAKDESIVVLVRVKVGQVNFLLNGTVYTVKENEKRMFYRPNNAAEPVLLTDADLEAMLDLLMESAGKIKDAELWRMLEEKAVSVQVRVRKGRVNFQMKEQKYLINSGEKRIFDLNHAKEPLTLTDLDLKVMLELLVDLAAKVRDEELGRRSTEKVLPTGAVIFAIQPEGAKVMVGGVSVSSMSPWKVDQELLTAANQYAHVILPDRTIMTIGPESSVVLQQTPVAATGANQTTVQLSKGSIQVLTSKTATQNGFGVSTPLGEAVAMGTDYHVEVKFLDNLLPRVIPNESRGGGGSTRIIPPLSP